MEVEECATRQDLIEPQSARTYLGEAVRAVQRLASRLRLPPNAAAAMADRLALCLGPLGEETIPAHAPWPSEISDDGSPYELSVVLEPDHPEVRVLWESQGTAGDLREKLRAGLETQRRLEQTFGVTSDRLAAIFDLFLPEQPEGKFVIWHAARLYPVDASAQIKLYLNPQVRGRGAAASLVQRALELLGLEGAWLAVDRAMPRGPDLDEILYFSLDLWADSDARVKVYLQHHDPTPDVLGQVAATSPAADIGELVAFYRAVTADEPARTGFPVLTSDRTPPAGVSPGTCLSFVASEGPQPVAVTLHVGVRSHVADDLEACRRATAALSPTAASLHRAAVEALAKRPLGIGRGLVAWLSLRSQRGKSRTTSYLSAESFSALRRVERPSAPPPIPPVERLVDRYEAEPLTLHPLFRRLAREPVDLAKMWLVFHNASTGISEPFPRWLALTISRVEDARIRCVLAEQLYEELGSGDPARTHRKLFLRALDVFSPWKPAHVDAEMEAPARRLAERLDAAYRDDHPYAAVGAAIVIELLGKHVDVFVGEYLRRQQELDVAKLDWLTQHETLELDHADESMKLAGFVESEGDRAAAWRGGRAVFAAGWKFYSEIYALCFP